MGKFIHRVGGQEIPRFGGVHQECDPGAIPPNMFRNAVNVRYQGGRLVSRGGQAKFNASALLGRIQGIFCGEYQFVESAPPSLCAETGSGGAGAIDGPRLYILAKAFDQAGAGPYGGFFFYFSKNQDPVLRLAAYPPLMPATTSRWDTVIAPYGDGVALVGGEDAGALTLKEWVRGGTPALLASLLIGDAALRASSIAIYNGVPYLGVYANPTALGVYRYNAATKTLTSDDLPAGGVNYSAVRVAVLGSDLYAIYDGGSFAAVIRRKEPAMGWVDITTVPPFQFQETVTSTAVYDNALHFITHVGGNGKVVGSTVTIPRRVGGLAGHFRLAVFNGYLYYFRPGGTIGRFDGTTWIDAHKDLSAQFSIPIADFKGPWFFGEFEGNLVLVVGVADMYTETCYINIFSSPGVTTSGTWVAHLAHHNNQNGPYSGEYAFDVGCIF